MLAAIPFALLISSAVYAVPLGPSTVQSYKDWDSIGCFTDALDARTLQHPEATHGGEMTVERCLDACHGDGYSYAGVEFGVECYCGNTLPTQQAADGSCDMTCAGNPLEYCGGSLAINVYQCDMTESHVTSIADVIIGSTTIAVPLTETTTIPVPITGSTTIDVPITDSTTITDPLTETTTIAVPITGTTTIADPITYTTTIDVPIPGITTIPTFVPGSTSIVEPATVSTTVATIVSVPSESLHIFESISRTLSVLTGTTSFVDSVTTIFEPIIILTTLSKTLTESTEVAVLVPTTSYEIIPEPTITTIVVPALVPSDIISTYTTTSFDLEPATSTSFDIEPVTTTSFDIEPFPSTSFDIEPVTTTSFDIEPVTSTSFDIEPVPTTSYDIELVTTTSYSLESTCASTYVTPDQTDCNSVAAMFGISPSDLHNANKFVDCSCIWAWTPLCIPSTPTTTSTSAAPTQTCAETYTSVDNDTCDSIGHQFGVTGADILAANSFLDCQNIWPYTPVCIPQNNCVEIYTSCEGDTCQSIGSKFGLSGDQIYQANTFLDCDQIWTYTPVCIPPSGSSCTRTIYSQPGDTCESLGHEYGVSGNQIHDWNSYLTCDSIWDHSPICVSHS